MLHEQPDIQILMVSVRQSVASHLGQLPKKKTGISKRDALKECVLRFYRITGLVVGFCSFEGGRPGWKRFSCPNMDWLISWMGES